MVYGSPTPLNEPLRCLSGRILTLTKGSFWGTVPCLLVPANRARLGHIWIVLIPRGSHRQCHVRVKDAIFALSFSLLVS